jgi:hypothetical protein
MKCSLCGKPIVLKPSAAKRAKKYGGKPEDYPLSLSSKTMVQRNFSWIVF